MTGSALNQVRAVASPATPTPRRSNQEGDGFRSVLEIPQKPAREPDADIAPRPDQIASRRDPVAPRRDPAILSLALALDANPAAASLAGGEVLLARELAPEIADTDDVATLDDAVADDAGSEEPKHAVTDDPLGWLIAPAIVAGTQPRLSERPMPVAGEETAPAEKVLANTDASRTTGSDSRAVPVAMNAATAAAPMLASESKLADTSRRREELRPAARDEAVIKSGVRAEEPRATPVAAAESRAAVRLPPEGEVEPAKPLAGAIVTGQQSFAAPQTPATTVAAVLAADPSWSVYFREAAIAGSSAGGVKSLKIQLHPAELGVVTAHLRVAGDTLTVELQADTEQARRHLVADTEQIVRSLRALGIDIDKVTVQAAPSDDTGQRQQAAGGRDSGFASAGGSSDGRNGRSGTGANPAASGDEHAAAPAPAADSHLRAGDTRII
ncbi:MAG: flagellar hook-length control protein FliK [Mesorhizobium sp.]|nr:flagellar hook-length control protein FliK [Mesorhizobium sp.]